MTLFVQPHFTFVFFSPASPFVAWLTSANKKIGPHGSHIDEYNNFRKNGNYINFLDIQYCIDEEGRL